MYRATLLTDGSSDVVLLPILWWLLNGLAPGSFELRWADLRGLREPPRTLRERVRASIEMYPCELLFVHRDAERQDPKLRYEEIEREVPSTLHRVCVVPVRMQEAWLLHDEGALRTAAGRPSGRVPLGLPQASRVESLADPKEVLHRALRTASEATGRQAKQFNPGRAAHRLAELIVDWTPLRALTAFQRLEQDTQAAVSCVLIATKR